MTREWGDIEIFQISDCACLPCTMLGSGPAGRQGMRIAKPSPSGRCPLLSSFCVVLSGWN
jgi:hypothetical protein